MAWPYSYTGGYDRLRTAFYLASQRVLHVGVAVTAVWWLARRGRG